MTFIPVRGLFSYPAGDRKIVLIHTPSIVLLITVYAFRRLLQRKETKETDNKSSDFFKQFNENLNKAPKMSECFSKIQQPSQWLIAQVPSCLPSTRLTTYNIPHHVDNNILRSCLIELSMWTCQWIN